MKLSSHLCRLVLLAVIPVLLFAAAMIYLFHRQQRAHQEKTLVEAAQSLSLGIDRELLSSTRHLETLATSEHLDSGNFKRFYEQSQRSVSAHGAWEAIVLVDLSGQQLTNTRVPFGSQLPRSSISEVIQEIVQTGRPGVSNLFSGPVAKTPVIAIGVPVVRDGKTKYVLTSSTSPKFLGKIFQEQKTWRDHRSVVIDRNKITLARVYDIDKYLGKPAGSTLAAKSREAPAGFFYGSTLEGLPLASGFHRSQLSGWTVAVALPLATLNAPLNRMLLYIGAGGMALLALGLLFAKLAAGQIHRPIAALATAAEAIGRGETPVFAPGSVAEIDKAARSLAVAAGKRRQVETALRESEERVRAIFEQAAIGVAEIESTTGRFQRVNAKYCRIVGYTAEELHQLDFMRITHPDDLAPDLAAMERLKAGALREFALEKRLLRKDGSAVWVNLTVSPTWSAPDKATTHIAVIEDISARKVSEAELANAEKRFRALIENSGDGIALFDREKKVVYLSPSTSRITGRTPTERLGRPYDVYLHPDDVPLAAQAFAEVMENPSVSRNIQLRTRHKNDSWRWMEAVLTNMLDEPHVQALVSNYRDITERKEAEQEIQRALAELQELHEVSVAMLQSSDLKSLAQTIVAKAVGLSACDLGIIRLRERDPNSIRVIASQGYRDPANRARHEKAAIYAGNQRARLRAFSLQRTEIVRSLDTADRMATFKREGIRSLITIPVAVGDNLLGILQLGSRVERDFEPRLIALLETLGQDFGVALQKSQLLDETLAAQEQLRELSRRLVDTQESERRYIARELHDEIGSLLTALKITVGMGGGPAVEQAKGIIDEALAKARNLAQHLHPPMLDHLGLAPTLEWYAREFTGRTQIGVKVNLDGVDRRFASEIEIAVFRIFQEALTNIARHAKARDAVARLACTATTLGLTIHDHGVGFDTQAAFQQVTSGGLSGMRERITALGGRITISSASDDGTVVEVEIPLPDQGLKEAELRR